MSSLFSKINKITVLGSGVMGHGIAQVSAMAGYTVTLRDIEKSFLDKAMEKILSPVIHPPSWNTPAM